MRTLLIAATIIAATWVLIGIKVAASYIIFDFNKNLQGDEKNRPIDLRIDDYITREGGLATFIIFLGLSIVCWPITRRIHLDDPSTEK